MTLNFLKQYKVNDRIYLAKVYLTIFVTDGIP
jgi:hypothetical protein